MVRTSMGPNGMNKMVINHLERLFVTSDARTIVTELEVQHPAGAQTAGTACSISQLDTTLNTERFLQRKY